MKPEKATICGCGWYRNHRGRKQIYFKENWKGRGYDGYVFAAPVTMDGKTVYVAAVVTQTSKNRFYLHEVVDSEGNIIKIDDGESATPTSLATDGDAGAQTPSPITNATIPHPANSVNSGAGVNRPVQSGQTENAASGVETAGNTRTAVQATKNSFVPELLSNLNQARKNFIEYAQAHFPKSVINAETGKEIGIGRTGLDKFLSGRIGAEKYATGFKIPELIERAHLIAGANNSHVEQAEGIPTYEYYDSPVDIDGAPYTAHIRVRNTTVGDRYYGHTISQVDEIEIEPSARTSTSDKPTVQPVNAIDDSTLDTKIAQNESGVNSKDMQGGGKVYQEQKKKDPQDTVSDAGVSTVPEQNARSVPPQDPSTDVTIPQPANSVNTGAVQGIGENGTKVVAEIAQNSGTTIQQAQNRVGLAYQTGRSNLPGTQLDLTDIDQQRAYNAGQMDYLAENPDAKDLVTGQKEDYTDIKTEVPSDGAEEVHLRGSGQRTDGTHPGGAISAVESRAGGDQSRKTQDRPAAGQTTGLTYSEEVSPASLGIAGGSTVASIRLVTGGENVFTRAAKRLAKEHNLRAIFYKGDLWFREENGKWSSANGYISGDRIFVKVDHPLFTADQIIRHEIAHNRIAKGEINPDDVRARLRETFKDEKYEQLSQMYIEAYRETGLSVDEIWVEIICDSQGDMNIFSGLLNESAAAELLTETKNAVREGKHDTTEVRGPPVEKASRDISSKESHKKKQEDEGNGREMGHNPVRGRITEADSGISDSESPRGGGVYETDRKEAGVGVLSRTSGRPVHTSDSEGRTLKEEDATRLKKTVVVDEAGRPLAVYHFSKGLDFDEFAEGDVGFHFGTQEQSEKRRADLLRDAGDSKGRMFRGYLDIRNPIRIRLDINCWEAYHVGLYLWSEGILSDHEWSEVRGAGGRGYNAPSNKLLREILSQKGYDGLVYPNFVEGDGDSYVAFWDDQIIRTDIELRASRDLQTLNDLRRENETLRSQVEDLKQQTRRTREPSVRQKDVDKLAKRLVKDYGSTLKAEDIAGDIKALADYIVRGGEELSWSEARDRAVAIARKIVSNAQELVRGSGGDDEEKNEFEELQGHQAYALELPDGTSVTLEWCIHPEPTPWWCWQWP